MIGTIIGAVLCIKYKDEIIIKKTDRIVVDVEADDGDMTDRVIELNDKKDN